MPLYVADTHSIIWYFYDVPRLGAAAERAFDQVDAGEATLSHSGNRIERR